MVITSINNAQIKKLRQLIHRKGRQETGLYLVEAVIKARADIETIIYCSEFGKEDSERVLLMADKIHRLDVSAKVFSCLSAMRIYQGIAAIVRQQWASLEDIKPDGELCWVAVNAVQCPSNLGTILRIGDTVGAGGIILIGNAADPYYPTSVQASLGAIFTQKIVRTSTTRFAEWIQYSPYTVVGTSPSGMVDYREAEYPYPTILLMGNEWTGLTEDQELLCDVTVKIPMMGRVVNSHSVATAAGIVLYQMLYQRKA